MVFFAGWYSIFIDVGLAITIYRLIVIIFLLCLPLYLSLRRTAIKFPAGTKYLIIFIWYAVIVTVIARLLSPEIYIESFTRGGGRWFFQIIMLLIDITPVFLPLLFFRKVEDVKTTAKVFIASTTVLCILGWAKSLAYYLYRINIFPIFREGLLGGDKQDVAISMFGTIFHRMHSLGGEPKDFAVTVAIAIILLIILRIAVPKGSRFRIFLIGFFLISLFMSLATSGFFVLAMGLVLLVILTPFIRGLRFNFTFKSIAIAALAGIIFFGVMVSISISKGTLSLDVVKKVFVARTIERSPIEVFDSATLKFLSVYPQYGLFGVGMGNIHLYAADYLWPDWADYKAVFVPNSGYLEIISELGVIGFLLFLFVFLIPIRWNFKRIRHIQNNNIKSIGLALGLLSIFILIVYLMRANRENYIYISLGLLYFFNVQILKGADKNKINIYANRN
jgi:hypothetical protein